MIINVPSSAKTLVISFIGFQTQKVDVKSNVNVVLKSDAEVLDELTVLLKSLHSQVLPQLLKMKKSLAAKLLT